MKNLSTTAKVVWGIVIAVVIYFIYKMVTKPKSTSTTGNGVGSGFTVSNPNSENAPSSQSFNPSNPTSKNPFTCIDNCAVGDIQCVIKCLSGGADTSTQMSTINNIQSLINKNKSLTDQFKTNIQNSRTQGDALRSYQSYYNQNISEIKSLNDPSFNALINYANQRVAEVNSKLTNRDLASNVLNGANVNSTVLSLADKNRIIGDITFGKKWDDYVNCLKGKNGTIGAAVGGSLSGGRGGIQSHGFVKSAGEALIGATVGAAVTCLTTLL